MKILQRLKASSKWQTSAIAIVWTLFGPELDKWGVTQETVTMVTGILVSIIFAQMGVDIAEKIKK